jgi:cytochrome b subunit of formate dehydrogenase
MTPTVERFGKTTRWFHWSVVLPFLTLAGSGGLLLLREALGLGEPLRERLVGLHEGAGLALLLLPPVVLLSGDTRGCLADLGCALRWTRDDLRWLALQPLAWLGRARLPEVGKLNAGQKANALLSAGLVAGLAASGIWLWRRPGALVPWFAHVALLFAWLPAFCGHFFLAVIHPATRPALLGMLSGRVPRAWAAHHHPLWVRGLDAGPRAPDARRAAAPGSPVARRKLADESV